MTPFRYRPVDCLMEASILLANDPDARILAGGTNLIDLMKTGTIRPSMLIDISRVPDCGGITLQPDGTLVIGALARNSAIARDINVQQHFPLIALALRAGATPQIRNAATIGGNILQSTRCPYFFDVTQSCTLRKADQSCAAMNGPGANRALYGVTTTCCATYQSDVASALLAYDALLVITGPAGERQIPLQDLLTSDDKGLPRFGLVHGELIREVRIPPSRFGKHVAYVKVRERASFAFAILSVSACVEMRDGVVESARVILGSVATRPWRSMSAEAAMAGHPVEQDAAQRAGAAAQAEAKPMAGDEYKPILLGRAVAQALMKAADGQPPLIP